VKLLLGSRDENGADPGTLRPEGIGPQAVADKHGILCPEPASSSVAWYMRVWRPMMLCDRASPAMRRHGGRSASRGAARGRELSQRDSTCYV